MKCLGWITSFFVPTTFMENAKILVIAIET